MLADRPQASAWLLSLLALIGQILAAQPSVAQSRARYPPARWLSAASGMLNEIDNSIEASSSSVSSSSSLDKQQETHKSQQDYACGRAIATYKHRDALMRDQNYQLSMARNKYKPTDIRMPRIIGGDDTAPGEFPWTVSVKLNGQPICGGSLIEHSWILTAAHCVVGYNPKNLTVRLGAYRIKEASEAQTVEQPVSMFVVHKDYSIPRPFSNDIAMLKLSEPIDYTDFIIPICLPTEDQVSTSTSNIIVNDYSNQFGAGADDDGIVVSTKMSDYDIAKCFSRLQQNYLNSIGQGGIQAAATEAPASPSFSYANLLETIGSMFAPAGQSDGHADRDQSAITFASQHRPPSASQQPEEQVYYALPWTGRSHKQELEARAERPKLSRLPLSKELLHEIQSVGSGSMMMPSLGFELQPSDFVAMASDLSGPSNEPRPPSPTLAPPSVVASPSSNFASRQMVQATPGELQDDPVRYSGMSGTVVGWGWLREGDTEDQQVDTAARGYQSIALQKVKLPILRNSVCESWFQSQSKKITLLPSQFCAGFSSGGRDACRGDSGGPMIIEDNSDTGRYKLIGIVSAGIGCARPSLPGLYTRVASFLPWINTQMARH